MSVCAQLTEMSSGTGSAGGLALLLKARMSCHVQVKSSDCKGFAHGRVGCPRLKDPSQP